MPLPANDNDVFDLMEKELYAPVLADIVDQMGFRYQTMAARIRPLYPEAVVVGRAMPMLGMEVHEAPRLASNSKDILEAQMVVTVEPGLYFPGLWGIRIEDTVLVKENGCEKLTKMDKELVIIE